MNYAGVWKPWSMAVVEMRHRDFSEFWYANPWQLACFEMTKRDWSLIV